MKIAALVISLLISSGASAAAIDQIKSFSSSMKSMKGEFIQTKVGKKITPAATGSFEFLRPGKFIWEYKSPYTQLLQSDGTTLFIHDKDLNQVTKKSVGDAIGSSPAGILFGNVDLQKTYTLTEDGTADGIEWLKAVPKSKDSSFEFVRIGMTANKPVAMEIRDTFGQTTLISLKNVQTNISVNASRFKFVPPKDAEIN